MNRAITVYNDEKMPVVPKKCKNPLMTVTATIAYYMELKGVNNREICCRLSTAPATWSERKKNPEKFTLEELNILAKIFGVDITTLVNGLVPGKEI